MIIHKNCVFFIKYQKIACEKYYKGPKNQGLSAALSYLLDFYTLYWNKLENVNFDNSVEAAKIQSDNTPYDICIFGGFNI